MTDGPGAIRLRRMRWWDIADVAVLEQELFPRDPWTAGQFWSELAHVQDSRTYLLAEDDAGLLGYAGLFAVPPEADVQTVARAPRARGRGVGSMLLDALVRDARDRGCRQVLLEVRADNDPARRLYERSGFERVGLRRAYYGPGEDALVMRRRVEGPATSRDAEAVDG